MAMIIRLFEELMKLFKRKKINDFCCRKFNRRDVSSRKLASIPGASSVFKGGIVCYTNEVKRTSFMCKQETIETNGVVSEQCATELAENVANCLKRILELVLRVLLVLKN